MLLTVGAVAGPFYDRGHFRWLLVIGTFLVVFGHMMLSLCTEYWQCLLAQGFVIGIGAGCLFVPAVAIMPTYFSTKIGLALGIAASGSSTGGIIYPIMFNRLLSQVGFGWAVRILGFTALVLQLIPIFVMKMRVKPGKVRSLIDWTAFTDAPYVSCCADPFHITAILTGVDDVRLWDHPWIHWTLRRSILLVILCRVDWNHGYESGFLPCRYLERSIRVWPDFAQLGQR
jgi:MFS family permease